MRQVIKTILLAVMMLLGLLQSASAFSLAGPIGNGGDGWQVQNIGYGPPSDSVAPKNLGEEYRRNTPVVYYAFDVNFLDFFGSNGVAAVNSAIAVMNKLTNVSSYTPTLSEFPLETRHVNFQAQALGLFDLKSYTLGVLVRQMGLTDPVQYTWTLHDRYLVPGTSCPIGMEYLVVQRNFDTGGSPVAGSQTVSSLYSPYVNGVLYSYNILEVCSGSPVLAQTVPFSVDPLADTYSAVASLFNLDWGNYVTGLTRDDMMGLRYLLQTNNINIESAAAGSLTFISTTNTLNPIQFPANTNVPGGFGTYDLGTLLNTAHVSDPATLQALFPNVIATLISNDVVVVTNQTLTGYYTNLPGTPVGSPPQLVVNTNNQQVGMTIYYYNFENIVTNHYFPNTTNLLQTITIGPKAGAPVPAPLQTNISISKIIFTNVPSGDYYVLPNIGCGMDIVKVLLTNTVTTTNLYVQVLSGTTNSANTTTNVLYSYTQNLISSYNSYDLIINPVTCVQTAAATAPYAGIENIKFVQANYDGYLSQTFEPITNNYSMTSVATNSQAHTQVFQRVVTSPDFLFSAQDLANGNGGTPTVGIFQETVQDFNQANVLANLAGPGTIDPTTMTLAFNKSGPVYFNATLDTLNGTSYWQSSPGGDTNDLFYGPYFVWGSFNGTTNAPVVYPNGSSLDDTGMIFVQVAPATLANGTNGVPYASVTFTSTGGAFTSPYTWSAEGLPAGLSISSSGTLSGTPTQSGTFIFTLTMTDYLSRSVQWNYPLIIQ